MAVVLSGCGQKGALFIPTEPAARNRATVLESLRPGGATPAAPAAPAASAPASTSTSVSP